LRLFEAGADIEDVRKLSAEENISTYEEENKGKRKKIT
jgi:hypothetical protein